MDAPLAMAAKRANLTDVIFSLCYACCSCHDPRVPLEPIPWEPPVSLVDLFDSDPNATHWQTEANCLGVDADLFFPERGASTKEAKAVCQGCEVKNDCLEYALKNGEKFGIWGGLSERERRRIRRVRRIEREGRIA